MLEARGTVYISFDFIVIVISGIRVPDRKVLGYAYAESPVAAVHAFASLIYGSRRTLTDVHVHQRIPTCVHVRQPTVTNFDVRTSELLLNRFKVISPHSFAQHCQLQNLVLLRRQVLFESVCRDFS